MPGPKRKIYRGGYQENHPEQMEFLAAAAGILPGHLVIVNADNEFEAAGADADYFHVANAAPCTDPLTFEYEAGETVFGYVPRSRDVYLVRAAAGLTVAKDAPLYAAAGGLVAAAGTSIVGYSHFPITAATTAGELIDMRIK